MSLPDAHLSCRQNCHLLSQFHELLTKMDLHAITALQALHHGLHFSRQACMLFLLLL